MNKIFKLGIVFFHYSKKIILVICSIFVCIIFSSCNKEEECSKIWSTGIKATYQKDSYDLEEEEVLFDISFGLDTSAVALLKNGSWYELRATAYEQYTNLLEYYKSGNSKVLDEIQPSEAHLYPLIHVDATHDDISFTDSYSIPKDIFTGTEGYLAIALVSVSSDVDDPLLLHFDSQVYVEFEYKLEETQLLFNRHYYE